jgi:hypothetical protein
LQVVTRRPEPALRSAPIPCVIDWAVADFLITVDLPEALGEPDLAHAALSEAPHERVLAEAFADLHGLRDGRRRREKPQPAPVPGSSSCITIARPPRLAA